jgi:23S rRNA (cytosine1962-C5)-methyltransferase
VLTVKVDDRVATALRRGHPWIFREALRGSVGGAKTGDRVLVRDGAGSPLGVGLYDERSPLAIRLYARGEERLDVAWFEGAFRRAFARRAALARTDTDAYRLLNGEGDGVPGLVLDRYGHVGVLRTDGDAIAPWVDELVPTLLTLLDAHGVTSLLGRIDAGPSERKVERLGGSDAPDTIDVREHGMVMEVDLARGQKTGAFLDQRENRRRVRQRAAGAERMLNLYSYAGGFSIAAALGGARATTSVDLAPKAHASAQRSFKKNALDTKPHSFVTADVFAWLERAAKSRERFDLIVCDPPSFAPNERAKRTALAAYAKLHRACAALLADGGTLGAASCSSHVTLEDFLQTLGHDALDRSDLTVTEAFGPPEDHPTPAAFPEGRYLKFVWMR